MSTDLYTSLKMAKQAMNGGTLPPLTPLTEEALRVVDARFVDGMGAIREDKDRGLQCPICGEWRHGLTRHINLTHATKVDEVRRALGIPATARLCSTALSERQRSHMAGRRPAHLPAIRIPRRARKKAGATKRDTARSVGVRNLSNTCLAQLRQRLNACSAKIGRDPSTNEIKLLSREGFAPARGFLNAAVFLYGSWGNFVAQAGLVAHKRGGQSYGIDAVLGALRAWYDEHGTLPSYAEASSPTRAPLIPHRQTIARTLGAKSWREAMEIAASQLGIYGGRYGLPERKKAG